MKNVNLPFWTIFPMGGGLILVLVALVLVLARGCIAAETTIATATNTPLATATAVQATATNTPLATATAVQATATSTQTPVPTPEISIPEGWELLHYRDNWYIQKGDMAISVKDIKICPEGITSPCWTSWSGVYTFDSGSDWMTQREGCPINMVKLESGEIWGMKFPYTGLTCYELRSP